MGVLVKVSTFLLFSYTVIADEKYTTKYDNINYDEILKSERLLKNYLNCLLDKGKCTPEGAELKRVLPDALETACSKCSEAQKVGTKKIIRHLVERKPEMWNTLVSKYDPDGKYCEKYHEKWKEEISR